MRDIRERCVCLRRVHRNIHQTGIVSRIFRREDSLLSENDGGLVMVLNFAGLLICY